MLLKGKFPWHGPVGYMQLKSMWRACTGTYSGSDITYTGAAATFNAVSGLASGNITVIGKTVTVIP